MLLLYGVVRLTRPWHDKIVFSRDERGGGSEDWGEPKYRSYILETNAFE
jgi:hypothetical protein